MKTFRVYPGLDAFVIIMDKGNIYLPYIDVFANDPDDARQKVANLLAIDLSDQDFNPKYDNYVSENVKLINTL